MSKIVYNVNEVNKTIIGYFIYNHDDIANIVNKYSGLNAMAQEVVGIIFDEYFNQNMITRTAVCQDGDKWNVEYGKGLVAAKISLERNKRVAEFNLKVAEIVDNISDYVWKVNTKHYNKVVGIANDLKNYYGV